MNITETTTIIFTKKELIEMIPEEYRNKRLSFFYSQNTERLEIEVKY